MKKRSTEEQIIGFLREAEAGMPVAGKCPLTAACRQTAANSEASANGGFGREARIGYSTAFRVERSLERPG